MSRLQAVRKLSFQKMRNTFQAKQQGPGMSSTKTTTEQNPPQRHFVCCVCLLVLERTHQESDLPSNTFSRIELWKLREYDENFHRYQYRVSRRCCRRFLACLPTLNSHAHTLSQLLAHCSSNCEHRYHLGIGVGNTKLTQS